MAKKNRPKYPNRDRVIFRRFISQILFLIFGIGLAAFYLLFNTAGDDRAPGETTDSPAFTERQEQRMPPAASLTDNAGRSAPQNAPGSASTAPTPARIATAPHSPAAPAPSTAPAANAARAPGASTSQAAPPAPVSPFAAKSLDEVAAGLASRFGGAAPSAWGERLAGVTTSLAVPDRQGPALALTLDACGGKKGASYDADLITFLRERRIPATLFVTSLWMKNNPDALRDLAADPLFEIAAHGARHRPCSVSGKSVYGIKGTANFRELADEVEGNARDIERATGKRPRWFRSGTAYYDDVAVSVIHALGFGIAGYSIAGDEGATLPAARVAAKAQKAQHGDILLCHMNKPQSGTREGLKKALPELLERGFRFVRLSDIVK